MMLPAHGGTDVLGREIAGGGMQPARQHGMLMQSIGVLCESGEYGLRHVLGGVRLASHAKGGGVDKVNVSPDQFGERHFRTVLGKVAQ